MNTDNLFENINKTIKLKNDNKFKNLTKLLYTIYNFEFFV